MAAGAVAAAVVVAVAVAEHHGRHEDRNLDGIADQASRDERDAYALLDHELDREQEQPQRWVGVTRSPYRIYEPEEGPLGAPDTPGWGLDG